MSALTKEITDSVYWKVKRSPIVRKYMKCASDFGLIDTGGRWLGTDEEQALFLKLLTEKAIMREWKNTLDSWSVEDGIPWKQLGLLFNPDSYRTNYRFTRKMANVWLSLSQIETDDLKREFPNIYAIFD